MRSATSLLLISAFCAPCLQAHQPGLSTARVSIQGAHRLGVELAFAPSEIDGLLQLDSNGNGLVEKEEVQAAQAELSSRVEHWVEVLSNGTAVPHDSLQVELNRPGDGDNLVLRLAYSSGREAAHWSYRSHLLSQLPRGHRQYATVRQARTGELLSERLLSATDPEISFANAVQSTPVGETFGRFLLLGIEHILTGYDHLLFLLGFLLLGLTLLDSVRIITAFTLAHSLTLALSALNVVTLPTQVVEPLIALSILYVGLENLLRGRSYAGRWSVAFGFGLVHGLGFASVLQEIGLGGEGGGVLLPLLSFNLGVEAGQLAVLGLAMPPLHWLSRRPMAMLRVARVGSLMVAAGGLYWLLERI